MGESIFRGEFPKNVTEQAAIAAKTRVSAYLSKRLDLRGKTVFCLVNDEGAPAAFGFSLYKKGSVRELGIHIADVCEYVCEGSPLDIEAKMRSAAIRNGKEVSGMLPEDITHGVCDLTSGGDKLALSVLLDIDQYQTLSNIRLEETVIRVAEKCIFDEVDKLAVTSDSSSVMLLREKYATLLDTFAELYEMSAGFYFNRCSNEAPDNMLVRREFKRNAEGLITSYERVNESDSHAMMREVCYFVANAVGELLYSKNLPAIYIGQAPIPEFTMQFVKKLLKADDDVSIAALDYKAKGSPLYNLISDTIIGSLPCPEYSDAPIHNLMTATDKIVSIFRPTTRYTDLLTLRMLKTCIQADGDVKNLNIKRIKKTNAEACVQANKAEKFVYDTRLKLMRSNALEYIKNCGDTPLLGYPIMKMPEGTVRVILDCGVKAIVPPEASGGYSFEPGTPTEFDILTIGTTDRYTLVRPHR